MSISKVIIPAAGWGTRFAPLTKSIPKELLPLLNEPALQNVVKEGIAGGVNDFYIITNEDKKAIEHYFSPNLKLKRSLEEVGKYQLLNPLNNLIESANFTYINQPKMLGLGHAILLAKEYIGNEYFGVILPDDIIASETSAIGEMIKIAQEQKAIVIAVQEIEPSQISAYGCIKIGKQITEDLCTILDVIEKPKPQDAPSNLAIVGRYVFSPEIFGAIEEITPGSVGEVLLTDAITLLARKGHKVLGYRFKGKRFDTGRPPGWLAANVYYGLKSPEYGAQIRAEINQLLAEIK